MSATVAAALKKIAVSLLTDKKVLKVVGGIVLGVLIIIAMPIVAVIGIFNGNVEINTAHLHEMIAEQQSESALRWDEVETAMTDAGFGTDRIQEAKLLFTFALYNYSGESGFAEKLAGCFADGKSDADLISAVNTAFGTTISVSDFTNAMASIRASYIDCSGYTDPTTKNSTDLVLWAEYACNKGWGYVWGTYGEVFDSSLFEYKKNQYPDEVGGYADFIESHWLGGRTADCVGLIKGYGWFDTATGDIVYATNGMPDIGADDMYLGATEKGTIDTIPEIPGLAVWKEGHIGIYIGNGKVIHASGTTTGVIKSELSDCGFTHWLKIPYITYTEETE